MKAAVRLATGPSWSPSVVDRNDEWSPNCDHPARVDPGDFYTLPTQISPVNPDGLAPDTATATAVFRALLNDQTLPSAPPAAALSPVNAGPAALRLTPPLSRVSVCRGDRYRQTAAGVGRAGPLRCPVRRGVLRRSGRPVGFRPGVPFGRCRVLSPVVGGYSTA